MSITIRGGLDRNSSLIVSSRYDLLFIIQELVMGLHLHKDWSKVVRILAPSHVGLGDLISQKRGSRGEWFVMARLKSQGYSVASYSSRTQGDVWAINTHTCHGLKVTSIVLVQVKTSAKQQYRFPSSAQEALKHLVKDVRDRLKGSNGSDGLPTLRSTSRIVVSGWLCSIKDDGRCSFDASECISIVGRWADNDTAGIQNSIRNAVEKIVGGSILKPTN